MAEDRGPLTWFTKQTKSLYIARPDSYLNELIYKHEDTSVPRGAKLTVRASECALFFREGRCIGRIDPGTVALDTANIPFLGKLIVDPLTGGNHFLSELFFVSTKETTLRLPRDDGNHASASASAHEAGSSLVLGQYRDTASDHVVTIRGSLSYTIRVQDPVQLVVGLAGQSKAASGEVEHVLAGRLTGYLRQLVGLRARTSRVLDIVSNADAEIMSDQLKQACREEFAELGLAVGRLFDLTLSLDDASSDLLRNFGKQSSELILAKDDAFAQANAVMGQRAAMDGLAKGRGHLIMSGNIGGAFQSPSGGGSRAPAPRGPAGGGGSVLSAPSSFLILGEHGATGPYSARQLALLALSKGQSLDQVFIRRSDDPSDVSFSADLEPSIVIEFQRRAPTPRASVEDTAPTLRALEAALGASAADGLLLEAGIAMGVRMALAMGLAPNEAGGRAVVLAAAARLGIVAKPDAPQGS